MAEVTIHKGRTVGKTSVDPALLRAAIDRQNLTNPVEIVERMARDIVAARRGGQYGLVDLTDSGWTRAQAMCWGPTAHGLAGSPAFLTQIEVERLRCADRRPVGAEMAEVVDATRSPDARPGALERVMTTLSGEGPTAALFGLAWFGALAICLGRPLG
jgi:hypothetical protein